MTKCYIIHHRQSFAQLDKDDSEITFVLNICSKKSFVTTLILTCYV